jgi:adenosylmethionine-8-amino-7-oxononanoate aminotransferase
MKMARQYQRIMGHSGKTKFISRKGSYHGNTFGTMSISQNKGFHHELYEPLMEGIVQIPQPYHYRCEHCQNRSECNMECARDLERAILSEGSDTVAAFISEPISVSVGTVVPPEGYWPAIREICDRYDVLLILDEVITGFGRTGKWFASEHWGVVPDIMTTAKGISSGYLPRGAVIVKDDVVSAFSGENKFPHGITFASHPVACAAALANLEIIEKENLVENAARMGSYLLDRLQPLYEHASVGDVRGVGLMVGIEMVKDKGTKEKLPPDIWPRFNQVALEKGLRIKMGNVISLAPPFVVTEKDVDEIVGIVDELITEVERDQGLL